MSQAPEARPAASPLDALLLGALHGPAELLPISSSGQITIFAFLTDLQYSGLSSSRRKSIEIALHAGTASALALFPPKEGTPGPRGTRRFGFQAAMLAPTAVLGLAARGLVRTKLGTPGSVAAGLATGSALMLFGETRKGSRTATDVTLSDGLLMGAAQACALWPGVSRSAVSTVAARTLGFTPESSARLARSGLVATSLAASALELAEAANNRPDPGDMPTIAVGAAAAFLSAIAARPLATRVERSGRLWPWALFRLAIAGVATLRIRSFRDDALT